MRWSDPIQAVLSQSAFGLKIDQRSDSIWIYIWENHASIRYLQKKKKISTPKFAFHDKYTMRSNNH